MGLLTSITIWVASVVITTFVFLVSLIIRILPMPTAAKGELLHSQCFWWSDAIITLNPYWKVEVEGLENIDPGQAYVIVANHQSLADIVIIYRTRIYFKWVAKKELLKVPLIGWLLRLNNHVMLSRGEHGSIKSAYLQAAGWLKDGVSVLFFPEGTRSGTGQMNTFKNGAFKLAIQEGKKVLPVLISGTREAIPKGGWIFKTKVSGRITVLPSIDTSAYRSEDYAELRDFVRDRLQRGQKL